MTTRHVIITLYVAFLLSVLLSCLPYMNAQNTSFILSAILLAGAYILRKRSPADSLEAHHATFVIRTIWIWSLICAIGIAGAGWTVFNNADNTAFDTLMGSIQGGAIPTDADVEQTLQNYIDTNYGLMLKSILLWMAPDQLYALWRIARGLTRGLKGYRIQNLRSWL